MPPENPKKKKLKKEDSLTPPDSSGKPKKKKRKKEDLLSPSEASEKPKKKKRPKEDSPAPLEKPRKKKRKKKLKKKIKKKVNFKELVGQNPLVKKGTYGLLIILVVVVGFQKMQQSSHDKATSKGYSLALSALDKMQLRCTVLWSEIGIDKACSQKLGEMAIGKLKKDVELTVIEARSHRFTAQAKAKGVGGDKIFQINKKGHLFLNVNGCLAKVSSLNPSADDIEKLAKKCKSPA